MLASPRPSTAANACRPMCAARGTPARIAPAASSVPPPATSALAAAINEPFAAWLTYCSTGPALDPLAVSIAASMDPPTTTCEASPAAAAAQLCRGSCDLAPADEMMGTTGACGRLGEASAGSRSRHTRRCAAASEICRLRCTRSSSGVPRDWVSPLAAAVVAASAISVPTRPNRDSISDTIRG